MRVPKSGPAIAAKFKSYLCDSAATTSAIFGIAAIPFFMAAGVAVDMSRANMEQTAFHAALDSAALAIAADERSSTQGLSDSQITAREAELKVIAEDYVEANYRSESFTAEITALDVQITGQDVTLTATAQFPTTIMGVFGIDSIDLDFLSRIKKAMRPIEMVMVMDTTGSMASSGKIEGAKAAAHKLLDTLYSGSLSSQPRSEYLRTALVPFSGAVRLNKAAYDFNLNWIDTTGVNPLSKVNLNAVSGVPAAWNNYYAWSQVKKSSTAYHSWNGCVEARMRGSAATFTDYNTNDVAPSLSLPATLFPAYFNPDATNSTSSYNFGMSYITGTSTSASAVGSECAGLSSSVCSSTTSANVYQKQENWRKYMNTNIGAESTSTNGPWTNCTGSSIVPMTYDRAKVEAGIDAMVATGPTVIPEGLAWGWRVLSPTEPFTKVEGSGSLTATTISPYNDVRWTKTLVLMTDGDNDVSPGSYTVNGTTYTSYGFQGETLATNRFNTNSTGSIQTNLNTAMSTICASVKAKGVNIYVAAFGTGISTATKNLLKACASDPDSTFYAEATSPAALTAFFDHIGEDVLSKSIYVAN
jgi:Flp pilus assembly protein TadG